MDDNQAAMYVAAAMHEAMSDEGEGLYEDLPADEREGMEAVATVAMTAHAEWLGEHGFRIAPPGTLLRPKTEEGAKAMIAAGQDFLARQKHKSGLVGGAALWTPPGAKPH